MRGGGKLKKGHTHPKTKKKKKKKKSTLKQWENLLRVSKPFRLLKLHAFISHFQGSQIYQTEIKDVFNHFFSTQAFLTCF